MGSPAQSTAAGWTRAGAHACCFSYQWWRRTDPARAGRRPVNHIACRRASPAHRCVDFCGVVLGIVQLTGWLILTRDRAARSSKHRLDRDSSPARNRLWFARYRATCCRATNHRQHAYKEKASCFMHREHGWLGRAASCRCMFSCLGVECSRVMICENRVS